MYPAQERNCIQHHCYGGQGFLVTEELLLVTEEVLLVTEELLLVTENSCIVTEDKGCFFLFIALCWMQNPIGG